MFTLSPMPRLLRAAAFSLFLALLMLGLTHIASATIYYVTTTGSNFNTGLSWSSPQIDLQATIHAARPGDQVWVKTGTYVGPFTTVDGVALYGGFAGTETSIGQRTIAAHPTVLSVPSTASAAIVTVDSASVMTVTIDGFTIQNGPAGGISDGSGDTLIVANCTISANTNFYGDESGGGVYTSGTATFTNDVFAGNSAYDGGGVYATATATFTTCTFTNNSAPDDLGGGAYVFGPATLTGCAFSGNSAYYGGGGVYADDTATLASCAFTNNSSQSSGGGVYVDESATATLTGCTLTGNSAYYGGGVFINQYATGSVTNCTLTNNAASIMGGGVLAEYSSTPAVTVCTLTGNTPEAIDFEGAGVSGSPVFIKDDVIVGTGMTATSSDGIDLDLGGGASDVTIANDTIANAGADIYINSNGGSAGIANNVFYDSYGALNDIGILGPTLVSSHNAFYGNVSYDYLGTLYGPGDGTVNPAFANAAGGNYHLANGSPLVNAGDDSYVVSGDTDRDGHARIQGTHVDVGAYEAPSGLTVTSFTPASGVAGTSVTITGAGLTGATAVAFNGAAATTFHVVSSTQITVTVPAGATNGPVSVTTSAGTAYSATFFTILPPHITSFTPASGPVGTVVTITGTDLNAATVVGFQNAHAITYTVNSAGTQIMATVPSGAATGLIAVLTPGGEAKTATNFTVTAPPAPAIVSFAGTSGPVGTTITITGVNLTGTTIVGFQGQHAKSFTVNSAGTQITATVPAGAATGPIAVMTNGMEAKSRTNFTVMP